MAYAACPNAQNGDKTPWLWELGLHETSTQPQGKSGDPMPHM